MHIATLTRPLTFAGQQLPAGRYFLEDHNLGTMMAACGADESVRVESAHAGQPLIAGILLVVRCGGFGDLLWLNAIYERLSEKGVTVHHACFPHYSAVLQGFVASVASYPVAAEDVARFPVVWLENSIEGKPCVDGEHPADRLCRIFGLEPQAKKAAYRVTEEEAAWAATKWPRTDRKRVCVQLCSSGPLKSYPFIPKVLSLLHKDGIELVLVGDPRPPSQTVPKGVMDGTQEHWTIRESLAMMSRCDAVLGADSVFIHAAHALDIPAVGLFGPFDGATYMNGYRGFSIQGDLPCSPCHWHGRSSYAPPGKPCEADGMCHAIAKSSPDFVALRVRHALAL